MKLKKKHWNRPKTTQSLAKKRAKTAEFAMLQKERQSKKRALPDLERNTWKEAKKANTAKYAIKTAYCENLTGKTQIKQPANQANVLTRNN